MRRMKRNKRQHNIETITRIIFNTATGYITTQDPVRFAIVICIFLLNLCRYIIIWIQAFFWLIELLLDDNCLWHFEWNPLLYRWCKNAGNTNIPMFWRVMQELSEYLRRPSHAENLPRWHFLSFLSFLSSYLKLWTYNTHRLIATTGMGPTSQTGGYEKLLPIILFNVFFFFLFFCIFKRYR